MATVMDNIKPLQHGLTTPQSGSSLRPNPPPPYDSSRELGKGFLETCMLYVQLRPSDFPDDATKLGWILTFMMSGRAPDLAERDPHGLRGKECLPLGVNDRVCSRVPVGVLPHLSG